MGYMKINDSVNLTENKNGNGYEFKLTVKQQYLLNCFAGVECGKVYNLYDVLKDYCKKALQGEFKPSDLLNGSDLQKVALYMRWDGYFYSWTDDIEERTLANATRFAKCCDKGIEKLSIRTTSKGNYTFMVIDETDEDDIIKGFAPKTRFHISLKAGTFEEFLED